MPRQETLLELSTARLELLALSRQQLKMALENKPVLAERLNSEFADGLWSEAAERALAAKLRRMSRVAERQHIWLTYWVMLLDRQVGIGLLGFKGVPNAQAEVEIGYGVAPMFAGKGYTTEAAQALTVWALDQRVCSTVIAEVAKDNMASRRVVEKLEMKLVKASGGTYQYRLFKDD